MLLSYLNSTAICSFLDFDVVLIFVGGFLAPPQARRAPALLSRGGRREFELYEIMPLSAEEHKAYLQRYLSNKPEESEARPKKKRKKFKVSVPAGMRIVDDDGACLTIE
jgi:hypothetical protein